MEFISVRRVALLRWITHRGIIKGRRDVGHEIVVEVLKILVVVKVVWMIVMLVEMLFVVLLLHVLLGPGIVHGASTIVQVERRVQKLRRNIIVAVIGRLFKRLSPLFSWSINAVLES